MQSSVSNGQRSSVDDNVYFRIVASAYYGRSPWLNSQISDQQLHHLIEQIWGVTSVKKLKVDQIEALISWAKEDFFVEEVEAVLALIDGEHDNSNRKA